LRRAHFKVVNNSFENYWQYAPINFVRKVLQIPIARLICEKHRNTNTNNLTILYHVTDVDEGN